MFTHVRTSFESSLKLNCKLRGHDSRLWYASDWYGLLITVGGVGGDFSQTAEKRQTHNLHFISLMPFGQSYTERFVATASASHRTIHCTSSCMSGLSTVDYWICSVPSPSRAYWCLLWWSQHDFKVSVVSCILSSLCIAVCKYYIGPSSASLYWLVSLLIHGRGEEGEQVTRWCIRHEGSSLAD